MRRFTRLLCAAVMPSMVIACLAGRTAKSSAPQYDRGTITDVLGIVSEVRDNDTGTLPGLHLIIRTDRKRDVDVYVGPDTFVKDFSLSFARGERVQAIGSKIRCENGEVVLARELRRHDITVYVRDPDGNPIWHP